MADKDTVGDILKEIDFTDLSPYGVIGALFASDKKLQKSTSKTLKKSIENITDRLNSISKSTVSMADVLGISRKDREEFRKKLENLSKTNNTSNNSTPVKKQPPSLKERDPEIGKEKSFFKDDKPSPVKIIDISDSVLLKLGKYINTSPKNLNKATKQSSVDESLGFIPKLLLGSSAMVAGGIYALYKGLTESSKWRGTLKLLGSNMLKTGLRGFSLIGKIIDKNILKPINKMIVGVFEKIGPDLAKKFQPLGKKITSLLEPLGNLFKNLRGSLDNIILSMKKSIGKTFGKVLGKSSGKGIFKILSGKMAKFFAKGLKVFKRIPGLGLIISGAFAFQRFKAGDWKGGLLELASGLVGLVPGIGTAISIGIDVFNAIRDTKKSDETIAKENQTAGNFTFKGALAKLFEGVKKIPGVKDLIQMVGGFQKVFSGQYKEGLIEIATSMPIVKPLIGLFDDTRDSITENTNEAGNFSFKGFLLTLKDKISKKLLNLIPDVLGMRRKAAELMGLTYEGSDDSIDDYEAKASQSFNKSPSSISVNKKIYEIEDNGDTDKARRLKRISTTAAEHKLKLAQAMKEGDKKEIKNLTEVLNKYTDMQKQLMGSSDIHQDFIMRPKSAPVKFSSKDTIIGAKEGGPLVNLLNQLNSNFIKFANSSSPEKVEGDVIINNNNDSSSSEVYLPEYQPSFKDVNDVVIQRASFWRTNYGYVMP